MLNASVLAGFVGASSETICCGNGTAIPVGVETGGREVPTFADLAFDDVVVVATQRKDASALDAYREAVQSYQSAAQAEFVCVDAGAKLLNCPRIENSFVG